MTKRFFIINYNGGFALMDTPAEVSYLIAKESNTHIRECNSLEEAYVFGCQEYVNHECKHNLNKQAIPPRLEEMIPTPIFHEPGFRPTSSAYHTYAMVHPKVVGIFTTPEEVKSVLENILFCEFVECESIPHAQRFINDHFERTLFAMGAYFRTPIPTYQNLPTGTLVDVEYLSWLQMHLQEIPSNLQPYFFNNKPANSWLTDAKESKYSPDVKKLVEGYEEK